MHSQKSAIFHLHGLWFLRREIGEREKKGQGDGKRGGFSEEGKWEDEGGSCPQR